MKYLKKALRFAERALSALAREGMEGVYLRLIKKAYIYDGFFFWRKKRLRKILSDNYKGIIVLSPNESWDIPMFQRPQQMGIQFSNLGYLYFHCLQSPEYDRVLGYRRLKKNLFITNCHPTIIKSINKFIYIINNATHPRINQKYIENLIKNKDVIVVYDYLDHYSPELGFYPDWLKQIKQRLAIG